MLFAWGSVCLLFSSVRLLDPCWCPCGIRGCWAGPAFWLLRSVLKYTAPLGASVEQVHFLNLCRDVISPPRGRLPISRSICRGCWPCGFCRTAYSYPIALLPSFLPLPSTLRSPSSPIHEEDEEKVSEDSDAPLPPSGVELVLRESSSPEVRLASLLVRPWPAFPRPWSLILAPPKPSRQCHIDSQPHKAVP